MIFWMKTKEKYIEVTTSQIILKHRTKDEGLEQFNDFDGDGIEPLDYYIKNNGDFIKNYKPEKICKKYTHLLKEIMHEAKYKNY